MGSNRLSLTDLLRRPADRLDVSDHPVKIAFLHRDVILSDYFSEDSYLGHERRGIQ